MPLPNDTEVEHLRLAPSLIIAAAGTLVTDAPPSPNIVVPKPETEAARFVRFKPMLRERTLWLTLLIGLVLTCFFSSLNAPNFINPNSCYFNLCMGAGWQEDASIGVGAHLDEHARDNLSTQPRLPTGRWL